MFNNGGFCFVEGLRERSSREERGGRENEISLVTN